MSINHHFAVKFSVGLKHVFSLTIEIKTDPETNIDQTINPQREGRGKWG